MEFHVGRNELLSEIQLVMGIIEKKSTMPILENVLIQAENHVLTLQATDLELGMITRCVAQVVEPGSFTVNAKWIQDMLTHFSEPQVSFAMNEGSMLDVVCGSARFSVETMVTQDFPTIPEHDFTDEMEFESGFFRETLDKVIFSISMDPHKFAINGALLQVVDGKMFFVSTDGHRMSVFSHEMEGVNRELSAIIPRKAMMQLRKLLQLNEADKAFQMGIEENRIFFQVETRVLFSRLIDGKFPDFEKAIPTNNDKVFVLDRVQMMEIMRRKMVLKSENSKLVRLSFYPGKLVVVLRNAERGESLDEVPIEYEGERLDVGFNVSYVMEFLKNMKSKQIEISLKDAGNQGLFRMAGQEEIGDYNHIIMPMRLLG